MCSDNLLQLGKVNCKCKLSVVPPVMIVVDMQKLCCQYAAFARFPRLPHIANLPSVLF